MPDMEFKIPCDTFVRLNKVLRFKPDENRRYLSSIHIERKAGVTIAIATNGLIMAAERIDHDNLAHDVMLNLTIDPVLIMQCEKEIAFNSVLTVNYVEALQFATAKTTFGYIYPENAALHFSGKNLVAAGWRNILKDDVLKSNGAMLLTAQSIADLGSSSPSGDIIFPEFIDSNKPVVVCDRIDPNWFGLFVPFHSDQDKVIEVIPSKIPYWAK